MASGAPMPIVASLCFLVAAIAYTRNWRIGAWLGAAGIMILAGALAAPVWVALSFAPDWRWLLDRDDSPWYPTMRLFRQSKLGDWPGVFARIASELATLAAQARPMGRAP